MVMPNQNNCTSNKILHSYSVGIEHPIEPNPCYPVMCLETPKKWDEILISIV